MKVYNGNVLKVKQDMNDKMAEVDNHMGKSLKDMKLNWHNQMTQIDAAMAEYDKKLQETKQKFANRLDCMNHKVLTMFDDKTGCF